MKLQESDRMRIIVGKFWELKLQIHTFEKDKLTDVIGHVILLMLDLYLEDIFPRSLFVCVYSFVFEMMSTIDS